MASPSDSPLTLDITLIEDSDAFSESITLTDDGCGTTCEGACCTSGSD
jgi:FxLD family lantipeptide